MTADELEKILAKPHDELSPRERELLVSLYKPPEAEGPVRPVTREELRQLLSRPLAKLTDQERATLIAFRGAIRLAESITNRR